MNLEHTKLLLFVQGLAIVILVSFLFYQSFHQTSNDTQTQTLANASNFSLVSPRLSTGVLKPQSLLIFNFKPLQEKINNYIDEKNLNVSVFVLNIRDGAYLGIRAADEVEPASLNKLPIAIEIMRKVERGELTLDTKIDIKRSEINDRSGTLYEQNVSSLTIGELMRYMLSESDNTATLVLLDQVNLQDLKDLSIYLDYYTGPIDTSNPQNNVLTITPRSTSHLFVSLYLSTILELKDSEYILSLLKNTSFDIKKYARLPDDVIVVQKYGSYHNGKVDFFHSCGIMYIEDSRIFYCVMTRGLERENASLVVGDIVHDVYTYVQDTRSSLKKSFL